MSKKSVPKKKAHLGKSQWLSCSAKDAEVYIEYMKKHGIRYRRMKADRLGEVCLLIPRQVRPFSWKLKFDLPTKQNKK